MQNIIFSKLFLNRQEFFFQFANTKIPTSCFIFLDFFDQPRMQSDIYTGISGKSYELSSLTISSFWLYLAVVIVTLFAPRGAPRIGYEPIVRVSTSTPSDYLYRMTSNVGPCRVLKTRRLVELGIFFAIFKFH